MRSCELLAVGLVLFGCREPGGPGVVKLPDTDVVDTDAIDTDLVDTDEPVIIDTDDTGPPVPAAGSTRVGFSSGGGLALGERHTAHITLGDPISVHRLRGSAHTVTLGLGTTQTRPENTP